MDWCLIAVGWTDPANWIAAVEVALGLGFIIFVHELGHFAVAKICGVKVDKFFIGFDIFGLKIFSFRWGETVYGIGILPLGGYVKMLGQEDNPAQLRKEMERAKQDGAAPATADTAASAENRADAAEETSGNAAASPEKALYDPRSYLAKSVPQRMAIISAGVIMNMIFAVVFAAIAYGIGVKQVPTMVGSVTAGGAAWQAGVEADDVVKKIGGHEVYQWRQMIQEIINADLSKGVPLLIDRPGAGQLEITVKPEQLAGAPRIGVGNSAELKIVNEKNVTPFLPESAAANATGPLMPGDRIEQIDGKLIASYGELQDFLAAHAGDDLTVTVARSQPGDGKAAPPEKAEKVIVTVPKSPMKQFGLVMDFGPIAAIQANSPAAKADIKPGDALKTIDGKPVAQFDPMTLPESLHKRAGTEISLGLEREGKSIELKVKLSAATRYAPAGMPDCPVAISELGAAYFVGNTVARVEPGSPAADAGMQAGDRITKVKVLPPPADKMKEIQKQCHDDELVQYEASLTFGEKERNWPFFMGDLQGGLPGTTVEFTWKRGDKETTAKLAPADARNWFDSQRGWLLEPKSFVQKADSIPDAVRLGWKETVDAASAVYRTLHSVGTNQVSARNLSGPVGIVSIALMAARQGLGTYLIFLTLISANLAVVNFLPIPVLDGGHIVLLLYEGIRGKPADERVQEILTWIGLIFILGLMVFVLGLDFGLIPRPGAH